MSDIRLERGDLVLVGAGRMGRGIAHVFAYAGHPVTLLDSKARDAESFRKLADGARAEIRANLQLLLTLGIVSEPQIRSAMDLIDVREAALSPRTLRDAAVIIECVPETREAKLDTLGQIGQHARRETIVTSTTSSMLVTELQGLIAHPSRFLNTHFLNPAFLIPLVEVSPGPQTDEGITRQVFELLQLVGKVPVRCGPSPGYIVPRLQALLMSEACRMVNEGVATPAELDRAITHGFGPRFTTMGIMEFIDWGGIDTLVRGGNYLAKALNSPSHAPPPQLEQMMQEGRMGLREGRGYYDYRSMDVQAYQHEKLSRFVTLLSGIGLLPRSGLSKE